ncbi:MAG: SEL1-like repeat protein [Candidatus Galacturonibacter soehngenii]|nr:SEL1-like repeat protein [Candidatus Galacturonibacter soehngenii]
MPFSPLISKIRCHSPNRPGSKNANRNNIKYIATRSGVDISSLKENEDINDKLRQKKDWTQKSMNEDILSKEADNDTYMRYIAERPRSHGLFGNIDTTDLDKVGKDIYDITKNGKNIYRGIISLSQKDAEMLGFTNKDSWNIYLRSVMPDICKELGISTVDFSWVAAYHAEKTHPHIHFQLWDNRNVIKSPFIHPSRQSNIRNMLSKEMFNEEYEQLVKDLTAPERKELSAEKNTNRNDIVNFLKDVFVNFTEYVPGINGNSLPERIENEEIKIIANELLNLIDHNSFKTSGSLDYKYLSPELKMEVNHISDLLLDRFDYKEKFNRIIDLQKEISTLNGKTTYEISKACKEAEKDIYNRMGNIVMKNVKSLLDKKESLKEIVLKYNNDSLTNNDDHSIPLQDDKEILSFDTDNIEILTGSNNSNNENIDNLNNEKSGIINVDYKDRYNFINKNFNKNSESFSKSLWSKELKQAMKEFYDNRDYEKALNLFIKCAQDGNPIALEKLGLMYSKGIGVDINVELSNTYYEKAFNLYNNLLETANDKLKSYINYRLGKMYENGLGTAIDYKQAITCYKYAIENSENKYAMYSLGKMYLDGKGADEGSDLDSYKSQSYDYIKKSADLDFAYAAYQTGTFYKQGLYVCQDLDKSSYYYEKAYFEFKEMLKSYEDDNILYRLGQMNYAGLGVKINIEEACKYLEKSFELKNENSALLLARIYIEIGNEEQTEKAISMLTELSNAGNNRANYNLGRIYATKECFKYDLEKAIHYYELADKEDNEHAQYGLGKIYADKDSKYFDEDKAVKYFKISADHNNSYAQYALGKIYFNPESKYYDMKTAYKFLEQSAENGNEHAAYFLGRIHADKNSHYLDIEKAIKYLEQASNCNHINAILKLANLYENEENINYFNKELSNSYYEKAFHILEEKVSSQNNNKNYDDYTSIAKLYIEGKGTKQDIEKGVSYLKEGCHHNNANAQYTLGRYYLFGEHIPKDDKNGLKYLNIAAENGHPFAEDTVKFYNDFKNRQSEIIAYDIFKVIHSMLDNMNRQQVSNYNTLKAFRNRGKQARKEEAIRLKIKSSSYEQEY